MATEMFVKPTLTNGHHEDDDEAPVVFKRSSNSASNHNHSNAHVQRSRVAMTSTTALPSRSPIARPNPSSSSIKASESSTSSSKASLVKSPPGTGISKAVKDESRLLNNSLGFDSDDEDSEDHVPLNLRIMGSSNEVNKGKICNGQVRSQRPVQRSSGSLYRPIRRDDADGGFHSSSKLQAETSVGMSGSKFDSLDEKKLIARKVHQNGSVVMNTELSSQESSRMPMDRPELAMLAKRLKDKGNSSDQSSAKRPKLPESSTVMKTKQFSVKPEKSDNEQKVLSSTTTMKVNQVSTKHDMSDDDTDHVPLSKRIKIESSDIKSSSLKQRDPKVVSSSKTFAKKPLNSMKDSKYSKSSKSSTSGDGQKKWTTLVHNGVIFPPPYKPHGINIRYKGTPVKLSPEQEEVATMFAVMKDTLYYDKPKFRENFWNDWRRLLGKNHQIQSLDDCDFGPIYDWSQMEKEKKKQMSSEEKKALREEKLKQEEKYMWAIVDGVKEKVGNFRVEPPGLFRGRGEHPKMGKLKRRIHPSDITINIGKDAPIPECPIAGERWREVKHDNTVTWLAFWNDPINPRDTKYVFLAASSALKGQSDKEKYEKARKLKEHVGSIRAAYRKDFTSKDVTKKQIAVATYLIDKLALRAGNEKDDDEADTVGCCTLKVGNVECIPPNKLKFDFLGKDSIQYVNTVEVEPPVYKAIGELQSGKSKTDDLFDELDTSILNAHLKELMPGLTAKVFRTYNASITLDEMLNKETKDGDVAEKLVVYQQANKQVAIICNHQRSVSKSHGAQVERLSGKIIELKGVLEELQTDLDRAKKGKPPLMGSDGKRKRNLTPLDLEKSIAQTNAKIEKMERDMQTKEDMKTVALGTSKMNYMDPRVTVAWCKRHEVPIEKLFNKTLLAKFAWAMDVDPEFRF